MNLSRRCFAWCWWCCCSVRSSEKSLGSCRVKDSAQASSAPTWLGREPLRGRCEKRGVFRQGVLLDSLVRHPSLLFHHSLSARLDRFQTPLWHGEGCQTHREEVSSVSILAGPRHRKSPTQSPRARSASAASLPKAQASASFVVHEHYDDNWFLSNEALFVFLL
jgi:hypothetical protein